MPEYLAPGVYIEETSYRAKTIEGVSTTVTGFVGPTRFGPTEGEPELLTSFAAFERIYGGIDPLQYGTTQVTNFMAHAVRAFFENGGTRLYAARTYRATTGGDPQFPGHATWTNSADTLSVRARYPGKAGNVLVTFAIRIGPNILSVNSANLAVLNGANNYDLVWAADTTSPIDSPPGSGSLYWLEPYFDEDEQRNTFRLQNSDPGSTSSPIFDLATVGLAPDPLGSVRIITVDVTVSRRLSSGQEEILGVWEGLTFHPEHRQSLSAVFAAEPRTRSTELYVPIVFASTLLNGVDIAEALRAALSTSPSLDIFDPATRASDRVVQILLKNGNDGSLPEPDDYEGTDDEGDSPGAGRASGLKVFENIADISIVAAPGSSYINGDGNRSEAESLLIANHLISHCERMRYRIAVLDSINKQITSEVREYRGRVDSKHAALYYPWVTTLDPITGDEIRLPPSGFVAGIYARNDVEKGVHKAPANEVVRLAIGFEVSLNKAQQDELNPEGVNSFRFFDGRGYRLWGARTISSDPEWKYVNLRRYFAYLERSIELGTQWAVFENNDHRLWANIRRTIEDFLYNEWKSGRLFGEKPEEAYFVRCDLSTMTQNDLDNGRLVCLIGVAPVRPAEFVIFRIGQWTADRRN